MSLTWNDLDLDRAMLTVRGELGKSRQERRGRIVPISTHLVHIVAGWGNREGYLVPSNRQESRERLARPRDMGRASERAGVRKGAWEGRPHHAFRKGFVSGLRHAEADTDVVEVLVGHSLGLRGVYTDPDALPMRQAVDLIPPITESNVVVRLKRQGQKK
jgi:integrase